MANKKLLDSDDDRLAADMYQDESEIKVISMVRKIKDLGSLEEKYSFLTSVEAMCLSHDAQTETNE